MRGVQSLRDALDAIAGALERREQTVVADQVAEADRDERAATGEVALDARQPATIAIAEQGMARVAGIARMACVSRIAGVRARARAIRDRDHAGQRGEV